MKYKIVVLMISLFLMAACMPVTSAEEIMARMDQAMENLENIHQIQEMRMGMGGETADTANTDDFPAPMIIEQWSKNRTMARSEQRTPDGELHNLVIVNGRQMVTYDVLANTYSEMTLPGIEDNSAITDSGMEMIEGMLARFNFMFVGVENVADRPTFHLRSEVVDSDQDTGNSPFSLPGVDSFELWIDSETYVMLGLEMQGEQFSMSQRTTFIDFEPQLSDELFVFTPPEGAERMDMGDLAMPELMTADEAREAVDYPLLAPTFVPEGFTAEPVYVIGEMTHQFFRNEDQQFLLIQMPEDADMADGVNGDSTNSITMRGQEAVINRDTFGPIDDVQVSWVENGVRIIVGGAVEESILIQIAESLE